MKLIITGASGFIGQRLIPYFDAKGYDLLLVGRHKEALQTLFPNHKCTDYKTANASLLEGYECCLHLAARNNQYEGSLNDFLHDNVEKLQEFCKHLIAANVNRQIYVSSILAEQYGRTPYAQSKWQAEQMLLAFAQKQPDWCLQILRPAFIHALPYRGKLAFLNKLPAFLSNFLFQGVTALKHSLFYEEFTSYLDLALVDKSFGSSKPEILTNKQQDNMIYSSCRFLIDRAFALSIIVIFGWFFPLLVFLIRQNSEGPALLAQQRIGKSGVSFPCYKFRTMHIGTKQAATHEVSQNSVTSIGRFLRKYKIDELPQVWNILRGEISLVGPRPCLPIQDKLINCRQQLGVLDHLPGITGYAQINNIDMSDPERLAKVDADYISHRTLILDVKIILQTFLGNGLKDKTLKAE